MSDDRYHSMTLLTREIAERELVRLTYRRDWRFSVIGGDRFTPLGLRIDSIVEDADSPGHRRLIEISSTHVIPAVLPAAHFMEWVVRTLREREMHELDEWLRVDGKRLHKPH